MKETGVKKKAYEAPRMTASQVKTAAQSVCGWYTQCGSQVKCRK